MSRLKTDAIRNVNASVDGITLDTSGNVVIPNELQLADKIVHTGDTNTAIRFLANDTVSVETAGSERLRVTSGGSLIVGNQTSTNYKLCVSEAAHTRVEVISTNNDSAGAWFKVFNSGTLTSQSTIRTSGGSLQVYTGTSSESEKLRIDSSGRLLVGLTASIQNTAYLQLKGINQSDICLYWPQDAATAGSHISWRTDGGGAATEITRIFCGQATTGADGGYMTFLTHNGTSLGERMRIDSSGRVLINTITAGEATSDSLTIQTRSNHAGVTIRSSTSGSGCVYFADGTSGNAQYRGFVEYVHSSDYLKFGTTAAERFRIDSAGRLLLGTTASFNGGILCIGSGQGANHPSGEGFKLAPSANTITFLDSSSNGSDTGNIQLWNTVYNNSSAKMEMYHPAGNLGGMKFYTHDGTALREHIKIDYNGEVRIQGGGTNITNRYFRFTQHSTSPYLEINHHSSNNLHTLIYFKAGGSSIGEIRNSNGNVQYYTGSDYRLKENITTLTNAITRLKNLKPSRFNFLTTPSITQDGFIAHELQEVVPTAVTGTKDEVVTAESKANQPTLEDSDIGDPVYQNVEVAGVVPLLTAALQEALVKIETLEAKVAALESA